LNGSKMKKNYREIVNALSYLTQLGLNVVVSFGIWIWLASWVRKTFGLGNFVSVIGVILGAGSGFMVFIKFSRSFNGGGKGGE